MSPVVRTKEMTANRENKMSEERAERERERKKRLFVSLIILLL